MRQVSKGSRRERERAQRYPKQVVKPASRMGSLGWGGHLPHFGCGSSSYILGRCTSRYCNNETMAVEFLPGFVTTLRVTLLLCSCFVAAFLCLRCVSRVQEPEIPHSQDWFNNWWEGCRLRGTMLPVKSAITAAVRLGRIRYVRFVIVLSNVSGNMIHYQKIRGANV